MLTAYFDIPAAAGAPSAEFGKKGAKPPKAKKPPRTPKPPRPTEAHTSGSALHAQFVPLPPETNAPKPAEAAGQQAWHALQPEAAADDDVAAAAWDEEPTVWEEDEYEEDEVSEPDFEVDSLEPSTVAVDESLSSSLDEPLVFHGRTFRPKKSSAVAVYSGPRLCYEDDDFE